MADTIAADSALPQFRDILAAHNIVRQYLSPTPLHHYPGLDSVVGAEIHVKHENYQPIGAFKVRGGINFMAQLEPRYREAGVVTASTGNHGQSIAYAAGLFHVRAIIVVPENANPVKVDAIRSYGAEVAFLGLDFEESKRHAARLAEEQGLRFISSGDEPSLISGVGTHTLEILQARPDIDVIIVPIGGGSGASGACIAAKSINPQIRVVGVGAEAAPAAYQTWKTHAAQTAPIGTFAGGLATGEPFMMPQRILWEYLDDFVLVSDDEMRAAIRILMEKAKTLAEPAGAAPLAAAIQQQEQLRGLKVALILSGGNISLDELRQCL